MTPGQNEPSAAGPGRTFARAILESEEQVRAANEARRADAVLPDDLLPGLGEEPMSFREALRSGGVRLVLVMFLLNVVDDIPRAIRVVAPDIQQSLDISDATLHGVLGLGGVALALGAVPVAWFADRITRVRIVPLASTVWAATLALTGAVANAFQLFWTTVATGLGRSYRIPVSGSLLADTYPIQARNRIFGFEGLGRPLGLILGPLLVGLIAATAGGDEGWRWVFPILAIPPAIMAMVGLTLDEPERGGREQRSVLGGEQRSARPELPVGISAVLGRLKKVRSLYFLTAGVAALGFALTALPLQFNLLMEDRYGFDALDRGIVESLMWIGTFAVVPVVASFHDRRFGEDPNSVMRIAGWLVVASGVVFAVGLPIEPIVTLVIVLGIAQGLTTSALVAAHSVIAAVAPFRMRAQAFALLPLSIFLVGGFFGGLLLGALSDARGHRTAMLAVVPAACLAGGLLIVYGSRFVRRDMSLAAAELLEEQRESERIADPDIENPVLQVRGLDVSYGNLQVLFDVDLEVHEGEVLALLGANGAGKSTLLKAVSGLLMPDRGVIRLRGQTITLVEAETRTRLGILQIRGEEAVWPTLTVDEHLDIWSWSLEDDRLAAERTAEVLATFPALEPLRHLRAGQLSGGLQHQLALSQAIIHDPELLIIDELTLGLAPLVAQELLGIVDRLKARGMTMVLVEQSVNVALGIADTAVFMERGAVRFHGEAQDLLERDDLLRAVFLSGEGA